MARERLAEVCLLEMALEVESGLLGREGAGEGGPILPRDDTGREAEFCLVDLAILPVLRDTGAVPDLHIYACSVTNRISITHTSTSYVIVCLGKFQILTSKSEWAVWPISHFQFHPAVKYLKLDKCS